MSEDTQTTEEIVDNESSATVADKTEASDTPTVENRDGKLFVDGVRVYSREDTNRIAANSKKEVETRILSELGVEDLDSVKSVIQQLQTEAPSEGNLNIDSLRDAVKKKDQTMEELRAELTELKTNTMLKDHLSQLQSAMPSNWTADQKSAVVDLMKGRDMLVMENDTFAIRNGDSYITDESGEKPDYAAAVSMMGKALGLPTAKTGVTTYDTDKSVSSEAKAEIDQDKLKSDPAYRNAYIQLRERNKNLSRDQITDSMIRKQIENSVYGSTAQRSLYAPDTQQTTSKRRK